MDRQQQFQQASTQSTQKPKIKKAEASLSTNPIENPWIQSVCVLKFDTELGQVMEHQYPPNALNTLEEKDITSLAFPESNSVICEGNLLFTFRLRHYSKLPLTAISPSEHQFSFGFTIFNQKKDQKSARGFTQRSIVIMSDLYFVQFYYQLVGIVASKCQFHTEMLLQDDDETEMEEARPEKVLKQFYQILNSWPIPIPGQQYELNVFGYLIQIDLPKDMLENLGQKQKQKRIEYLKSKGIEYEEIQSTDFQLDTFNTNPAQSTSLMTDDSSLSEDDQKVTQNTLNSESGQINPKSNQQQDEEEQKQNDLKSESQNQEESQAQQQEEVKSYEKKSGAELEQLNNNNRYRIDTSFEKENKSKKNLDLIGNNTRTINTARSKQDTYRNNQQENELITYLTKQYSCSDMFGELIIQKYFLGQSFLVLWHLWEIAITEDPLLIVGDDPTECSHIVLILLSLISPLKTLADYRPYITLYDSDIKDFSAQSKKKQLGNVIMGVSNPFLITFLGQFENVLHFERGHFIEKKYQSPKDLEFNQKCLKSASKLPKEVKHSLVSTKKLYMKPNKIALKHLNMDKSVEESLAINNWILRKHFKEMTEDFLSSFNKYLQVNWAVKGTGDMNQIKFNLTRPFKEKEFFDSIHRDNSFCKNYMGGSKDKTIKLYKKFINTTLFRKYLNDKKKEIGAREVQKFQNFHSGNLQTPQSINNLQQNYQS